MTPMVSPASPLNIVKCNAVITGIINVNADINLYKLRLDQQHQFSFLPGQFVMVILHNEEGKEVRRAYSIASSPHEKGHLELCVKHYQDGKLSPLLFKLRTGDTLGIEGPYGRYVLRHPLPGEIIFIAAGTGIAPIMSFIRTLICQKTTVPMTLFYGFRYPDDYLYQDELEQYSKSNPAFTLVPTISTKENVAWNGKRGYVQDLAKSMLQIEQGSSVHAYLCGPPGMVESAQHMLLGLGMKKDDIFKEQWE